MTLFACSVFTKIIKNVISALSHCRHRDPSYDFAEVGKWPIHVQVSHYATVACKRLERVGVNGKRAPKKPTLDEIDQARVNVFMSCEIFTNLRRQYLIAFDFL